MIATPTRSRSGSKSPGTTSLLCISFAITVSRPIAVGSSMATVAVLDTNAESRQVMTTEGDDHPGRRLADAPEAHDEHREPLRETVLEHRLGEDERPDEREDGGGPERRQRVVDRHHADHDDGRDPDEAADRDRHRLGDPEDHDAQQHRGQPVLALLEPGRQQQHHDGDQRSDHQARRAPGLLEPLLALGELLLAETAIRRVVEERLVDVGALDSRRGLSSSKPPRLDRWHVR